MKGIALLCAAGAAVLLALAGPAQAQADRTFVSGHGADTNPCSLSAPCRSFAQALTQTNPGGEIAVLDSAGYGAVTIDKSVSIVNEDGVEAGITVTTNTDGIFVSVGTSDVVNLRGLTLTGSGVGANGISFSGLGALNIQNCVIRGFATDGIIFSTDGNAALNVSDTIVSNITEAAIKAVLAGSGGGTVSAAFNRVQAIGSGTGLTVQTIPATGTVSVTIANSAATDDGIGIATTSNGAQTQVMVSNSVVSNNSNGVTDSGANSTTYLAKNTISGNGQTVVIANSGTLLSFGDNYIKGNADDGTSPAIPTVSTR